MIRSVLIPALLFLPSLAIAFYGVPPYKPGVDSTVVVGGNINKPEVSYAENVILKQYGDTVSVTEKGKYLLRAGYNDNVSTDSNGTTVMNFPAGSSRKSEFMPTTNTIRYVASSSTADTGIEVYIEGFKLVDSGLSFVSQTKTLNGRTPVLLDTAMIRAMYIKNNSTTRNLSGQVEVADSGGWTNGVANVDSLVHLTISAGQQASEKASTSTSYKDYYIVTEYSIGVLDRTTSYATGRMEIKPYNSRVWVPLTRRIDASGSSGTTSIAFDPYNIIPPNHDIRFRAISSGASVDVEAAFRGYLAIITGRAQ